MTKKIQNLILPFKNEIVLKWQNSNKEVVWMFLKTEKSLITKNYKKDSNKTLLTPIIRFNVKSPFGQTIRDLYRVRYEEIKEFI